MGDTNMCTDNPIILKRTLNSPTIICLQKRAEKIVPEESDIVEANKIGFNDEIGEVTNRITEMIVRRDSFPVDSEEYKKLSYRIMCGQHYQQETIDRVKGIIAKSMPEYWYSLRGNKIHEEDTDEVKAKKTINEQIAATKKPYFMCYVYPKLKSEYNKYVKNNNNSAIRKYGKYGIKCVDDIRNYPAQSPEMSDFIKFYDKLSPVDCGDSTINRICWFFEDSFRDCLSAISEYMIKITQKPFDYTILKSKTEYSKSDYLGISKIFNDYKAKTKNHMKNLTECKVSSEQEFADYMIMINHFRKQCFEICPSEEEMCNIVLDLCYQSENSKKFAWDVCGDVIIKNLLQRNDNVIHFPQVVSGEGEFEYCGRKFTMKELEVDYGKIDSDEGNPRQVS